MSPLARVRMKRVAFLFSVYSCVTALDNGVCVTPPMGYNTYQSPWPFQGGYTETIADALTATGLKDLGVTKLVPVLIHYG